MRRIYFQFVISFLLVLFNSCKESPSEAVYNNYYTIVSDSLSDPSVMPKIVFTNPSNGAVGPFDYTDPTQISSSSKITIQLNKLINVLDLKSNTITLKANDIIVPMVLSDQYYASGYGYQYNDPLLRNILIFNVQNRYVAAKTYTFTIDTTLTDIHGHRISQPYRVSFVPEPQFRVYSVAPTSNSVEPDDYYPTSSSSEIGVRFNSKVDSTILTTISISPRMNGTWNNYYNDSTIVVFNQIDPLSYNTKYTVSIPGSSKDANNLLISSPYQFSFTTSPFNIQLNSYSIGQGPGGFTINNNLGFQFNGPVDTSTVRSAILVSPSIAYTISFYTTRSNYKFNGVRLTFNEQQFQRNTKYTISFKPIVHSTMGDVMVKQYDYAFTTGL